ncbi:MAG: hypothetical protein Q4E37_02540 [Tissierellia bacterium]|nr:hypothetical protein [Tissierellia bacterium]
MFKNNLLTTILQLIASLVFMVLALAISRTPQVEAFFYGSPLIPYVLVGLVILVYYYMGKLLKRDMGLVGLLLSGVLPLGLALFWGLVAFLGLGRDFFTGPVGASLWRLPYDIFVFPAQYASHLLGFKGSRDLILVQALIPPGLMILSNLVAWIRFQSRKMRRRKERQDV